MHETLLNQVFRPFLSSTFAILPASEGLAEGVEEELAEAAGKFFHSLAVAGM